MYNHLWSWSSSCLKRYILPTIALSLFFVMFLRQLTPAEIFVYFWEVLITKDFTKFCYVLNCFSHTEVFKMYTWHCYEKFDSSKYFSHFSFMFDVFYKIFFSGVRGRCPQVKACPTPTKQNSVPNTDTTLLTNVCNSSSRRPDNILWHLWVPEVICTYSDSQPYTYILLKTNKHIKYMCQYSAFWVDFPKTS